MGQTEKGVVIKGRDVIGLKTIKPFITGLRLMPNTAGSGKRILAGLLVWINSNRCIVNSSAMPVYNCDWLKVWFVPKMIEHTRNNRYCASARAFLETMHDLFTVTPPKIAGSLRSCIDDNFQMLKYAS
jgi:hypothetical protein